MKLIKTIAELRRFRTSIADGKVGFVPTMGYLHSGHASLMNTARRDCRTVIASIFVNPTQFAPTEDLSAYPRDIDSDIKILEKENVDALFAPSAEEIYPGGWTSSRGQDSANGSYVEVAGIKGAEFFARPGHFTGVATVVTKLFNIVQPDKAYFGQKDALQCIVIRKMVRDLNFPVDVVVCPTLREENGLAMSSRNSYLTVEERSKASVISKGLFDALERYNSGDRQVGSVKETVMRMLNREPLIRCEYVSIADLSNGQELTIVIDDKQGAVLSVAVFFNGKNRVTRLIDNVSLPSVK